MTDTIWLPQMPLPLTSCHLAQLLAPLPLTPNVSAQNLLSLFKNLCAGELCPTIRTTSYQLTKITGMRYRQRALTLASCLLPLTTKLKKHMKKSAIKFTTKSETLEQFKGKVLCCSIPEFTYFSLDEWCRNAEHITEDISRRFQKNVIVRSSALCEDGANNSHAGAFTSILDVDPCQKKDLRLAIDTVFASYPRRQSQDQVLIQSMVQDIAASGVILTRCVDDGSPYYVINYDDMTGTSDTITSGKGIHKTVLVYRNYNPEYCDSGRVRKMLVLAQEVENLCGSIPLDIEFALDNNGVMHLLQVRRISTVANWHPDTEHRVSRLIPHVENFIAQQSMRKRGLLGDSTIFGNMPDWNPAELIGVVPHPLAASLFRLLISSNAWSEARARMGYRRLPKTDLMIMIAGRPFIDVRASFNSFLPDGLPDGIGERLVNAWIKRLADNPMLHDKVEFEVAHTVLDFSFHATYNSRYDGVLSLSEKHDFQNILRVFTNNALDISDQGSLSIALRNIEELARSQQNNILDFETDSPCAMASHIAALLDDCLQYGTIPFTIIARHAFIAESFLRSAISMSAILPERIAAFKSSFKTIMTEMAEDTLAVSQGNLDEDIFIERYGHLRPGTFDIMSPCYMHRSDLFNNGCYIKSKSEDRSFSLQRDEEQSINALLSGCGIEKINAQGLFEYARKAIAGREYAKFIFTKNLSHALESISKWGTFYNLGREDLSYLRIDDILETNYCSARGEVTSLLMQKVDYARMEQSMARLFKLTYLIRGVRDIHVVPVHRSEPNFITQKNLEGTLVFLNTATVNCGVLKDRIVCIENADPGFDWIFTKGIAGLVTQYGGANSHMAIRCAELQLPAAIGCGEVIFSRLRQSSRINLDCGAKTIRPIDVYE